MRQTPVARGLFASAVSAKPYSMRSASPSPDAFQADDYGPQYQDEFVPELAPSMREYQDEFVPELAPSMRPGGWPPQGDGTYYRVEHEVRSRHAGARICCVESHPSLFCCY